MATNMREDVSSNLTDEVVKGDLTHGYVYIDTEEGMTKAIEELSVVSTVAFDTEGVNLGRNGALTIAVFRAIKGNLTYVVDVKSLGGDRVFGSVTLPIDVATAANPKKNCDLAVTVATVSVKPHNSELRGGGTNGMSTFRAMLEDASITKIMFDCRRDSEALFHQFGVTLRGVLDLQVLEQAVRIQHGEAPPESCPYVKKQKSPYVRSMKHIAEKYTNIKKSSITTHCLWNTRPLSKIMIEYAANDVRVIKKIYDVLAKEFEYMSDLLIMGVRTHSKRYEGMFRDRADEVSYQRNRDFVMCEHPIVRSEDLPACHPRRVVDTRGRDVVRWYKVVRQLQSGSRHPTLFNDIMVILQHDRWYTNEAFVKIQSLAKFYAFFSPKQIHGIAHPSSFADNSW